jgi:hypothetical protein
MIEFNKNGYELMAAIQPRTTTVAPKPRIITTNALTIQQIGDKTRSTTLSYDSVGTILDSVELVVKLVDRIEALERYVRILEKTYVITDSEGNVVRFDEDVSLIPDEGS